MALLYGILFFAMLLILAKSAGFAAHSASKLARAFHFSEFLVSSLIVAVISASPETIISFISAFKGIPEFGLGTLLGSNVADLTLVFAIVALFSAKGIKVKSVILKRHFFYLMLLLLPVALGWDGHISKLEGGFLIIGCLMLFIMMYKDGHHVSKKVRHKHLHPLRNFFILVLSLSLLLISAYYTIKFGVLFAEEIHIPAVVIGLLVVSLGTCLPELFFSYRAVKDKHYTLALGDILGTVIFDATLIIGIISLIHPLYFDPLIMYTAGVFMFLAGLLVTSFILYKHKITKTQAVILLLFYLAFVAVQIFLYR